jgi:hypothetical protein
MYVLPHPSPSHIYFCLPPFSITDPPPNGIVVIFHGKRFGIFGESNFGIFGVFPLNKNILIVDDFLFRGLISRLKRREEGGGQGRGGRGEGWGGVKGDEIGVEERGERDRTFYCKGCTHSVVLERSTVR